MAGSLNHIVANDGSFTMETVENMGDASEALAECHQIIAELLECLTLVEKGDYEPFQVHGVGTSNKPAVLKLVCQRLGFPVPASVPVIERALLGYASVYQPDPPREWFIWSEEHNAWWRPNSRGYTDHMAEAGRYSFAEAEKIVTNANRSSPPAGKKFNEQMVRIPMELI